MINLYSCDFVHVHLIANRSTSYFLSPVGKLLLFLPSHLEPIHVSRHFSDIFDHPYIHVDDFA